MSPDLDPIVLQARDLSGTARAAYLDETCAGDADLRDRINARMAELEKADAYFNDAETMRPSGPRPAIAGENPGDVIGRYRLLQQIGEGGFGTVWMAEQHEPVHRRVALKIVRLGMDTHEFVARFEQERQALAMMEHPNIARVLDGGATPLGRPFFVMELVRGVPITKYCDDEKLSMEDRLALFMQVCHAIQHAHLKGIIHRDIKPTNILVSLGDEGKPVAKVIDFGVAKAIDRSLTDKTLFTRFEQIVGTPAYMSPEQAGTGPLDVDTRSDIYSLGVLLYELLTGRPPFDPAELMSAGIDEMRRVIREDEPPKPSTRLSTLQGPVLTLLAHSRHMEGGRLLSSIKGDLDWIVMKALSKSRVRRYETASGFAADVERYLRHEPVSARPPSFGYRAGKFIRKHKGAAAAFAAILLALLTGAAGFAWQAWHTAIERDKAVAARNDAVRAKEDADLLAATSIGILRSADPAGDVHANNVQSFLRHAAEWIETKLAGRPELLVQPRAALGETCHSLGYFKIAIPLQEKVVAYYQSLPGKERELLKAKAALAWSMYDDGRMDEGIQMQEDVLRQCTALFTPKDRDAISAEMHLAVSLFHAGQQDRARQMLKELLPRSESALGKKNAETLLIMHWLAVALSGAGQEAEAKRLKLELLPLSLEVNGPKHPDTIRAMSAVAGVLSDEKKKEDALKMYNDVLSLSREVNGDDHRYTLCCMVKLAGAYEKTGDGAKAYDLLKDAHDMMLKVNTMNHPDTVWAMTELARFKRSFGDREGALQLRKDAVAVSLELRGAGPESPQTLGRRIWLAQSLADNNQANKAVEELQGVLAILSKEPAKNTDLRNWAKNSLAAFQPLAAAGVAPAAPPRPVREKIVGPESEWKWLHPDDGREPDESVQKSFSDMAFDDSAWKKGTDSDRENGGFGYGDLFTGQSIGMPANPAHRHTAYFRHAFETTKEHANLEVRCRFDDGIFVYLDGKEVGRGNVESGDKDTYLFHVTHGLGNENNAVVHSIPLSGSLSPGPHVLAISLHNFIGSRSDLFIGGITLVEVEPAK